MAGAINTLLITRSGAGRAESMMPAYSAQLFSFLEGSGSIHFPERETVRSSDITLNAPMLRAAPMILEGPVVNVGVSFTPLGWACFSGLAADKVHDTAFDVSKVLAPERARRFHDALGRAREGAITLEEYAREIEDVIRQVCAASKHKPREDHIKLVNAIDAWLSAEFSPSVDDLYAAVDLGQRQVQRLCRRYYGVPPAQLVKRYRAIRAAMLLAHGELSEELRDEVLSSYFDQAHLIHDIRRYTGRTPKGLIGETLAQDMLAPKGHGQSGRKLLEE